MPSTTIERRVDLPAKRLLELLSDVEAYPKILPVVKEVDGVEVSSKGHLTSLAFRVRVKFTVLSGRIGLKAKIDRKAQTGAVEVVKGPFSMARGSLTIAPDGDSSIVRVTADYATPIAAFQTVIDRKAGLLADWVVAHVCRYAAEAA